MYFNISIILYSYFFHIIQLFLFYNYSYKNIIISYVNIILLYQFEDEQKVRVRHILRKHKDSRRPSSWRLLHITQTKEDSCDQIQQMKQILMHTLEVDGFDEMVIIINV